ncbi:hypothetical protein CW745_06415 [Psychromonas sp. psych-6C06]|uniref:hypothetical protein n=1 Tax=Psychromonas sp. psych-6C06 TaxID=2058089 RepID=UPI000C31DCFA|nr:hypothetical protein [Psychromonas sp. psych-6C06]PKF63049.1 hypothetical protein CW745_06415 [Psychromonas sp. psych-6C06]
MLLLILFSRFALSQSIVVWDQLLTHPNSMVPELLKRALEVTEDEYGKYHILPSEAMEQGRVIKQMQINRVDIAVFAPNEKREKIAIPIRIPVTGSLLSYRICLIQPEKQAQFEKLNSLESLITHNVIIGQHQNWPDTKIMEANGLTLWKANKYSLLFDLLASKRFDCFSRGANEVVQEFYTHGYKGLVIENHLIIYYPLPLYYFVNLAKPKLAERLAKGLDILQKNGEYEAMFSAKFGETLQYLNMDNRIIIELENPLLSEPTRKQMQEGKDYYDQLIRKVASDHE